MIQINKLKASVEIATREIELVLSGFRSPEITSCDKYRPRAAFALKRRF